MLRLNAACSPQVATGRQQTMLFHNCGSWILQRSRLPFPHSFQVKALRDETNGGASGFTGRNWEPDIEIEVPFEQRPVNEYSSLKNEPLYSWGELSPRSFFVRLGKLWLITFTVLGAPIAAQCWHGALAYGRKLNSLVTDFSTSDPGSPEDWIP